MTRISLLATAIAFPARIAARAGASPAVPTMEISTQIGLRQCRELDQPFRSAVTSRADGQLPPDGAQFRRIVECDRARTEFRGLHEQRLGGASCREADDLHPVGNVASDF